MIEGRSNFKILLNHSRDQISRALRPTSDDFPRLSIKMSDGAVKVKESERVLDEKVTTKTEEYLDENGEEKVRTVEIVEKIIEKEVPNSEREFSYTAWNRQRRTHYTKKKEFLLYIEKLHGSDFFFVSIKFPNSLVNALSRRKFFIG